MLDSGCARTVFPMDADYGVSSEPLRKHKFTTASVEMMESGDAYRVHGTDEYDANLALNGVLAPVHKPLVSTAAVSDKNNDVWMSKDGGYIIRNNAPVQKALREAVDRVFHKHNYVGTTPVYKERGVYNF